MNSKELGKQGENAAADFLRVRGYRIRTRNFRVPIGEIDIVAEKEGTLVFVEVKTRRWLSCGTPAQAVNHHKQRKIIQTAQWYLRQYHCEDCPCRFDVLEVYMKAGQPADIRQIQAAFET